jgi:hypothetical protein
MFPGHVQITCRTVLYCTMVSTSYDASHAMYSPRESIGRETCLSFGPNRNLTFPHGYFCSECKAYEQDKHSNPFGRGSRLGKRYKCTVNHTEVVNRSEVGGRQLSYYASTQVARIQAATGSGVARGRRGVGATIDRLKLKILELEASVSVAATEVASKSLIIALLQNSNTLMQDKLGAEELRISHVLSQLNDERDAHNSTRIILKHEREINEGDTNQNSAHVLALQDDMDGMKVIFYLLSEDNEMLAEEKDTAIYEVRNVRRQNNRLSATLTPSEELNNPGTNARRKDKVVTMRERLNHILTHDATFKNLKHEKNGNILADVVYDGHLLNSQSKNALFEKARDELRETHFNATFLLVEIDKREQK